MATIHGPRDFEQMDRRDRTRTCYQHSALQWIMSERMPNQSLRDRFGMPESKSAIVSQVIAAAMDAFLIKHDVPRYTPGAPPSFHTLYQPALTC